MLSVIILLQLFFSEHSIANVILWLLCVDLGGGAEESHPGGIANKQDMEQAMTPTEVANSLGLPALKDRKWQIFKTSALKGNGLDQAMEW